MDLLTLLLALSVPQFRPELPTPVRPAASYSLWELRNLRAKWLRVKVEPISEPWPEQGVFITEVQAACGLSWTVWRTTELDEPGEVSGTLELVHHKPAVHFGQSFEGFTEVRLRVP